jgi:hypothetical protein
MRVMPKCSLPESMSRSIRSLGRRWATAKERPRVSPSAKGHWDQLLDEWIHSELPLVVRKGGGIRGAVVVHETGRKIILADNSPAQWAFSRAFHGGRYSLKQIRGLLERDKIPFAMVIPAASRGRVAHFCTLGIDDNLNKRGWKLCHVKEVGFRSRTPLEVLPLADISEHFRKLLAPSNHFLVPLVWGGLGEVPEVIDEIRKAEADLGRTNQRK